MKHTIYLRMFLQLDSVPHYTTLQKFPKKVVALPFEVYLAQYIRTKQEEIDKLVESRKELRQVIGKLQPLAVMHSDKIQIFEPSYRRGLISSPAS